VVFDTIIPQAGRGRLLEVGLALIVVAAARALFEIARSVALLRIDGRMGPAVEAAVWDRLLNLPAAFFRGYTAGELGARAASVDAIPATITGPAMRAILAGSSALLTLGLLVYLDLRLALGAVILVLVAVAVTLLAGLLERRYRRALMESGGQIAGLVLQLVSGIAKFRVAGVESRAFAVWAHAFARQRKLAYRAATLDNALAVFDAAYPVVTLMALFAMVALSSRTGISIGTLLAFNAGFFQFLGAVLDVTAALIAVRGMATLYERAAPILRTLPEIDTSRADPGTLTGDIEISHVTFRYKPQGPAILNDISLRIKPGEFVALVGASGSGKSTLFRLLLGFETPQAGAIYYDGQELTRVDLRAVRRQIGVVLQNGKLLTGTILENITGATTLTLEDAWEAARMAGLDADIHLLPMGMHTYLAEGGGTLSGGQRQRLLIARAIAKRPRLVFFDEATSALDNRTQQVVGQSLERLQATRVVIAHRLSTIMNADRIFVLDRGRIVQCGTYAELIEQPGLFAGLARRQLV
jgi:ATP-binding cassette subfamily C protein